MNALRTVSNASRAVRFSLLLCLLALLTGLTPLAASAAPRVGQGGLGQALALMASLHANQVRAAAPGGYSAPGGLQRTPSGRVLLPRGMMRPGALRGNAVTGSNTTPIPGAVQTFDVNNPPPAFQPLIGFQNSDGTLGNNPANAPTFQPSNALTPTNLTPVWSADEKFIIFSSNRTLRGDVNTEGVLNPSGNHTSRFHLWAISVNGGEAFQITTSSATMSDDPAIPHGEFFPTLTPNDDSLAFTSDAQSSGTQNLFVLGSFSFSALLALNNNGALQDVSNTNTGAGGILSVTLRAPAGQTTFPTEAQSAAQTGFDQVQRPSFIGTSAGELVFSARSVTGANAGTYHLYFLFTVSGGSDPSNISFPGKLTDGPSNDTDPASTKDGQFIAFASTATTITTNQNPGPPSLTSGGAIGGNRSLFLIGGGGTSGNGLGVVPTNNGLQASGGRITTGSFDNFGPAWSFNVPNQFTNPSPGFEYLAFARGASQTSPHDIFYMQTVRFVNAGGQSQQSIEAATTPQTFNAPLYQINAGDLVTNQVFGGYRPDNDPLFNNGLGFGLGFFTGGTAETINPAPNVNTNGDPGTPQGIFLTDRNGTFSYTLPNLTAAAQYRTSGQQNNPNFPLLYNSGGVYTVRLHFSDPTSTAVGQRIFNVIANGQQVLTNFDIVAAALSGNGSVSGLVSSDGTPANAQAGLTITFTNGNGNTVATRTTTAPATAGNAPPNGDNNPTNYPAASLPPGAYTATITGAGFPTETQTLVVNNGGFTRLDFTLAAAATVTATGRVVNNSTGGGILGATIRVTDPNTNAQVGATTTTDRNGNYSLSVPVGTFNITAIPAAGSGPAALTQTYNFTVANPNPPNFVLQAPPTVGTLSGSVTDSLPTGPLLAGVTITIQGVGYQAIITTAGRTAPNFSVNLPGTAAGTPYTVTFSLPGYATAQAQPSITPATTVPLNQALLRSSGGGAGTNTAVVQSFNVTVPAIAFTDLFGIVNPANSIMLSFRPVSGGPPIVEGIEVLAGANVNGARTPISGFGTLTAAVVPTAPQLLRAIADPNGSPAGGLGLVTLTFFPPGGIGAGGTLGTPTGFNVFRSPGSQTFDNRPGTGAGQEGTIPLFSNLTPTVTNLDANTQLLTLQDPTAVVGQEYFYQVSAVFREQLVREGDIPLGATQPSVAIQLNTDDNSGETSVTATNGGPTQTGGTQQEAAQTGNTFDDVYPAWAPGTSIFSITYSSNRTVTYNDPATSFPAIGAASNETAISVSPGGVVNTSDPNQTTYAVGPNYSGIFESQVLNLDPPTLLRYNANEIIHVEDGNSATPISGVSEKLGIQPGQKVTFTVRLTDREAGIDNGVDLNNNGQPVARNPINGGPTGSTLVGPNSTLPTRSQVFLQIKDPNSKYQDQGAGGAANLEHKVFARDGNFNGQVNRATRNDLPGSDADSGSANRLLGLGFNAYEGDTNGVTYFPFNKYTYPPFGTPDQGSPAIGRPVLTRGAHGGQWTFPDGNNPDDTYIFVGKAGGGNNPGGEPGGDPALFFPKGPEYECQLVNPQFLLNPDPGRNAGDVEPADFRNPFWLAGVDDQQAFSGAGKTRPVVNGTSRTGVNIPAEWLQMVPSPVQDNRGGVLYTVTWTAPVTPSDFFLDVIAFDNAVFPNVPVGTSTFVGSAVNWRIYDNVGGFSTVQTLNSANSILVVSDYALGQKFAATTFAGRNSNLNLVPKLFGTESYLTDVDVSILPDVLFAGTVVGTGLPPAAPYLFDPTLFNFSTLGNISLTPIPEFGTPITTQNGLGVGSYFDQVLGAPNTVGGSATRDGAPDLPSQRYTVWRTLARGPVTDAVLAGYLPSRETQPAINDPQDTAFQGISSATILNAPRCVIWLSPYTGDLLTDPGSLNDPGTPALNGATARPSTQSVLRNFVLGDGTLAHPGGGRLFITGQDIGATLTVNGSVGNSAGGFLPDVLNATEGTPGGGSNVLNATANRITGSPFYDNTTAGRYLNIIGNFTTGFTVTNDPHYPYLDNLVLGDIDRNDAALDQVTATFLQQPNGSAGANIQGQIDTIAPTNGATVAATYAAGGAPAMVYHDDPFKNVTQTGKPNSGTGSRTVYAAFGIEAMSSDYYASCSPIPPGPLVPPPVIPRNPRQAILHNIVCYLRTATVTGIINQTAGQGTTGQTVAAGTLVPGVTVYLRPTGGAPPTRAAFSATTGTDGRYTINGVEPGTYTLVAYRSGFQRAVANNGTAFTLEGGMTLDNGTLTIQPLNPGSIAGNVKDNAGNVLIGATVTFTSTDRTTTLSATTRTGLQAGQPAGSYFVDNVPVATYTAIADGPLNDQGTREYTEATAPDTPFTTTGVPVTSNTTTQPVNFTLTPILATISGRVTAVGGAPVGNATVTATSGSTVLTTTTAADGTYTFTNVPAASTATSNTPPTGTTYTITVTAAGFGNGTAPGPVTVELGDVVTDTTAPARRTDVVLTPLASISGRIYDTTLGDPAGGPNAAGATVTLTSTGAGTPTVATTSAAADGTYTFANVQPGTYRITASKVGFAMNGNPVTVTVALGTVSTGNDIGLTPIPPGSITGRVTDANGTGVAQAVVTFVSADGTVTLNATADANGNYSIGTVFPGTYNGTATGPINPNGHPTTTVGNVTVTVTSGLPPATANFSVAKILPSIGGQVTDNSAAKTPIPNVLITVTDTTTNTVIQTLRTDKNGNYTISLPANGRPTPGYAQSIDPYTLMVTASLAGFGTQTLATVPATIYDGDTSANLPSLVFRLAKVDPGDVSGNVFDGSNGNAPVAGAVVTIASTDGTQKFTSNPSAADGSYVVPMGTAKAPSGSYIATVASPKNDQGTPEFTPAPGQSPQNITIRPDQTTAVNFVLNEIPATVSGTVTDNQTGKPIPGATVTITDSTGKNDGTTTTGADGTYTLASIPAPAGQTPASFNVTATAPSGYFSNAKAVSLLLGDVLAGTNIGLDEKGTITGLVTDSSTGQPLPNVGLTITDTKTGATVTPTTTPLVTTPGTAIGPDGKTSNYTATFVLTPGDTYAVTASRANFNPSAAVAVTPSPLTNAQVGRADIQLTSGIGTLGGLVSDATTNTPVGGATVTVTSTVAGVTTTVATFTTNGSVSPAPDGKTQGLNYSGQVAQGTYTVTLTFGSRAPVVQKVTVLGGQFNRLDFTGANGTPPLYTFPAGLQFLSTPYDYSSLGFDALFGILNTAPAGTTPNGNRTHVAVWDPTVGQYALDPNPPADSLRLGVGYWVFLKNPVPVTVQGATPSAAFVPVALHPDWNQIGVPNINGVAVSSLMFDNGAGGMISFATAASSQYHVVSPTLYSYDGNAYQPVTQSSVLQPWKAYWIKVFSNATIEIPTK